MMAGATRSYCRRLDESLSQIKLTYGSTAACLYVDSGGRAVVRIDGADGKSRYIAGDAVP